MSYSLLNRQGGVLFLAIGSSFAFLTSESVAYGDAPYYANDISKLLILEPGHLLWRPLGASIFAIASFLGYRGDILWVLQIASFLASVGSVLASYCFMSRWASPMVSLWGASIVAFSNGLWAYSISGSSYTAGLLFLLLALILASPPSGQYKLGSLRLISAGCCGGVAALFWLVYGLLFPILLGFVAVSMKHEVGFSQAQKITLLGFFCVIYGATVGLPLVGSYLLLPLLEPYVVKEFNSEPGFFGWLSSSSHGIRSRFGPVQLLRWMFGWPQSVIALGDLGQSVRLWISDGMDLKWKPLIMGSGLLVLFYGFLGACAFKLWRDRQTIRPGHRVVLLLAILAFILNSLFAFSWQATDPERYLPSLPFLILAFCLAVDLEHNTIRRAVIMVLSLSVLMPVNWYTTIYSSTNASSYKSQWLHAIGHHLKKEDVLVVLGPNKFKIAEDPHNQERPKIHNISMQVLLHPPQEYKAILLQDIQERRKRGGRIFIGDSVLGLDTRPRDGWSFKEHPQPSPEELDAFFSPMKRELAFSVNGEQVWMVK